MIKYVASSWQIEHVFDDGASTKLAAYEPETFVPKDIEIAISNLREKKPDPRFVYVHLIAMTDGDFYGSNLNGDIFDTDELTGVQSEEESKKNKGHLKGMRVPRYKTFETAKFFRNHANSERDAHYGDVEAAGWNDFMRRVELLVRIAKERVPELKMESGAPIVAKLEKRGYITVSMGCFVDPKTPIRTRTGYVAIADIKVGDEVFTHEGNWKRVTELHRRSYTGRVRSIRTQGFPLPIEVTEDHPWYATAIHDLRHTNGRADAVYRAALKGGPESKAYQTLKSRTGWTHARHLNVDDRLYSRPVVFESDKYAAIDSVPLARLMGFYLAEGSVSGGSIEVGKPPLFTIFSCNLTDDLPQVLPGLVASCFPSVTTKIRPHATSKVGLAVDVYSADLARFFVKYCGRRCENKFIAPELFLADREVQIAFLAAWLSGDGHIDNKGVHWSSANLNLLLSARDMLEGLGVTASIYRIFHKAGTGFNHHDTVEFTLNISARDAAIFVPYAERKLAGLAELVHASQANRDAQKRFVDGLVAYRIKEITDREVEDITVYNLEVEGDQSYLAYGFVSHNCKIAHEECVICKHTNELTIDRCEHLKHMMNEVMPDGRKVAARNYGMQFFDISDVNVPADPGAWSMLKVASASTAPNAAVDDAPSRRFKWSEMEKHTPAASDPLRDLDARFADGKTPVTTDEPPSYTAEELATALRKCAAVDVVLSTAAAAGIVFSPVELATLTALAEPEKLASDAFEGFGRISLDLFYSPVYDVLRSKAAARSGFCAPLLVTGWEPSKVAEQGATSLAQYYTAYRNALSSLSQASFSKTAQRTGALRDLVVDGDVKRAMYHLTFAGLLAPTTP